MPYCKFLNIAELEFLCPFFALGVWTRNISYARLNHWIALSAAVVYLAALHFFSFDVTMYGMGSTPTAAAHFYYTLIRLAGGVSGIVLAMYFIKHLMRLGESKLKWLAALGTLTLPIYALQGRVFMVLGFVPCRMPNLVVYTLVTAVVVVLSLVVYRLMIKNKYLALLFFGKSRG